MPNGSYFGGKGAAGTWQTLINEIPPHDLYIEPFLGYGNILRRKRPAARSYGIELDPVTLADWRHDEVPGLELHHGDGIEWLRHFFGVTSWPDRGPLAPSSQMMLATTRSPLAFVFADPPYPLETRTGGKYRFEFAAADHVRFLEVLRRIPALVMVTSYPNPLYEEQLRDWRTFRYANQTRRGRKIEQAWCNYPAPTQLHDSRFIGKDKRERERIHRRRRNWRQSIARMGPLERQALLDELSQARRLPAEPPFSASGPQE